MTLTSGDRVVLDNPEMRNDTLVSGVRDGQTFLYSLSSIDEVAVKETNTVGTAVITVLVLGAVAFGVFAIIVVSANQ